MCERQWAQATVSKQNREHAFCKCRQRLQTVVESKSVSTQGRGLFFLTPVSATNATEKRPLLAGNCHTRCQNVNQGPIQRSKLRPFWSPWRVEKKIGDQNCQEGGQFGDLFPDHLICFNLHPDIIKSDDHKTVQCPLLS